MVVRVGDATVDVLVGQQTWTLTHKWFELVWTGDYLLLWKMSPEGESTITRDSSEEEILWLETMLNRALHISTESSAEWRPLLVEKIKQFQKSHHLKTDGVVGFSTLVHLWQVAGESAYLYRDEANISGNNSEGEMTCLNSISPRVSRKKQVTLVSSPDKNTAP